jgi:hypothetical protein
MDMKTRLAAYALAVTLVTIDSARAQAGNSVPVTADNFARAESDMYFGNVVKQVRIGNVSHNREPMRIDMSIVPSLPCQ